VNWQEDWKIDSGKLPYSSDTMNRLMESRVAHGLPAFEPKPEGLEAIGYGMFFDSMFELADAMVGRGENGFCQPDCSCFSTFSTLTTVFCLSGPDSLGVQATLRVTHMLNTSSQH